MSKVLLIPRIFPNTTFSIKTFSTLTTVKVEERGPSRETVSECSCAVFLEPFGNTLSVPVEER